MRPIHIAFAAAALSLSVTAVPAAPFLGDTDAASGLDVVQVHNNCHGQIRNHGGNFPNHYHAGTNCAMVTTGGGGGGHCHTGSQLHGHGQGQLWHSHDPNFGCAVVENWQNYPQNNNCVQLGTPGFSFQLCD